MHKFPTAPPKSSGVLHRLRDPQAGAPDPQAGAPGLLNVPYSTFAGADPKTGALARVAQRTQVGTALRGREPMHNPG